MTSKLVSLHESLISKANTTIQKESFKPEIIVRRKIWQYGIKRFHPAYQFYSDETFDIIKNRQEQLLYAMEWEFFFHPF